MNILKIILALSLLGFGSTLSAEDTEKGTTVPDGSTADHSKFEELQQPFQTGPEVTRACLECHTEAAKQIHKTTHWLWEYTHPESGQTLGKNNVINNFCTATQTNLTFCSACHVGYDYKDVNFDFSSEEKVDCIVCHDTTATYKKIPGLSGHPTYKRMEWPPHSGKFIQPPDLTKVAQSVGKTSRKTCGACHFFGGGGNGVKHGDLDSSLTNPQRYLDVHMDKDGPDFTCTECHTTESHQVPGSRYNPTARETEGVMIRGKEEGRNPATCRSCHDDRPHSEGSDKLNDHTDKIACQTCHIPEYARGGIPTKMVWDWSTTGKLNPEGKPIKIIGSEDRANYDSKKGDFSWERNVIPEYRWFNGKVEYTLFGEEVDPESVVEINKFGGAPGDPESRIWPIKTMIGKQPYDLGNKTLAVFHTAGKDDAALWGNFDWEKALKVGMASKGMEYSGQMVFVDTEMSWPITHMVAPKDDALRCKQCHKKNGRLEGLEGVYLPARDASPLIDKIGYALVLLTLIGVLVHGLGRIIAANRRG